MDLSRKLKKHLREKLILQKNIVQIILKENKKRNKKGVMVMTNYEKYFAEQMQNEEFRKEYEALEPEFAIIQAIIDARQETGLTQRELSERTGIAQSDISKLENGNANPSIRTLKRLAEAMGKQLKISFV